MRTVIVSLAKPFHHYRHLAWALSDQALVSGGNFFTGIILARTLGVTEFGRFSLAWMVVLFVQSIQHAAINAPMMAIGPRQEPCSRPSYYGSVVLTQVIFAAVSSVLVLAALLIADILVASWGLKPFVLPVTVAVLWSQVQDFLRRYCFTIHRSVEAFTSDFLRYAGQLALLCGAVCTLNTGISGPRAIWIMAFSAFAASAFHLFRRHELLWSASRLRQTARRHWNFAKWLIASAFMQWTTSNLFLIAAGAMLGPAAVGALRAAQTLMGVTQIMFRGIENTVPVRAVHHYVANGTTGLANYLRKVAIVGTGATSLLTLVFATTPEFWYSHLLGDQFLSHSYLLRWYAIVYVLMFLGLPIRFGLRALEDTKPIFFAFVGGSLLTLITAYPLIKHLGVAGAPIGSLSVYVVMQCLLWIAFHRHMSASQGAVPRYDKS